MDSQEFHKLWFPNQEQPNSTLGYLGWKVACEIRAGRLPVDFSHATCFYIFRTKKIVVTSPKCERFARLVYNYYTGWGPPVISWFINHYNPH